MNIAAANAGTLTFMVGGTDQRVDRVRARCGQAGDAEACRHGERLAADVERLVGERGTQPLRDLARSAQRAIVDDREEFLATPATDLRCRGQRRAQTRRDLPQHLVAREVAVLVVDLLEAVDVEQ